MGYQGEVEVGATRFERMLLNLIRNAREAMDGPGQVLSADQRCGDARPTLGKKAVRMPMSGRKEQT